MKNIQVIDDGINSEYAIYSVPDDVFEFLFPGEEQDIEFIEDVIERSSKQKVAELLAPTWERSIPKKEVHGIHGTLFYGLLEKKKFYPDKREPPINGRLVE